MELTVDQIVAKLPHKVFPVIEVEPYYQSIHGMWDLLYSNTSTLATAIGGGNHGHIGITMWNTLYTKILPIPYNVPMDPGGTSISPAQATTEVGLKIQQGDRLLFYLTLPNFWRNDKGEYPPGITPGINPGILFLQYPRVMNFTLNVLEG